jgi:hypothetical protein
MGYIMKFILFFEVSIFVRQILNNFMWNPLHYVCHTLDYDHDNRINFTNNYSSHYSITPFEYTSDLGVPKVQNSILSVSL